MSTEPEKKGIILENSNEKEMKKTHSDRGTDDTSKKNSRSKSPRKHKKEKKSKRDRSSSKSKPRDREREDKKKSKKHKSKKSRRSRSRSDSRRRKSRKHRSRRSRSRSQRRHRKRSYSRRRSYSSSRSSSEGSDIKQYLSHYQDQIQNKGRKQQSNKHENAGLVYDGFHWVSPDIQQTKILRTVTLYGLPLDKCEFQDDHLKEYLAMFMNNNRLSDAGNTKPIVYCKINQEQKTAIVEFRSFEECKRFSILNQVEILGKHCKIVTLHTSNPYNQQQGLENAVNQGIVQATVMKAMEQIKGDLFEEKKNFYKTQHNQINGLIKQEAKVENEPKQEDQQQQNNNTKIENNTKQEAGTNQPSFLPALPSMQAIQNASNNNNNSNGGLKTVAQMQQESQQQQQIKLPPLPGSQNQNQNQRQGGVLSGLNLPQILTQQQAQQFSSLNK